jgi:hypothetical protein
MLINYVINDLVSTPENPWEICRAIALSFANKILKLVVGVFYDKNALTETALLDHLAYQYLAECGYD